MDDLSQEALPPDFSSEGELIARLKQKDEVAISWVWRTYYSNLVRYAFSLHQNASIAEEVVSTVFERFLIYLNRGKGPNKNVRAYLYRMTYNAVVDHSRLKIELDPVEETLTGDEKSPEKKAEQSEEIDAIQRALSKLTDDQRNLILLRFVEGLTMRETAEVMSKSINAIKTMQKRAVNSFRKTQEYKQLAQDYHVES